jgi:hypothetical protein
MVLSFCEAHKQEIVVEVDDGRKIIQIKAVGAESVVCLPTECLYLSTGYFRISPSSPDCYLEHVWESLNILFENFPGHLKLHHTGLADEVLVRPNE